MLQVDNWSDVVCPWCAVGKARFEQARAGHPRASEVVKDRFLRGYHAEGEAIGLAGDSYADAVRADEAQAVEYGINGVPFFVLDGRYGVSGAQPVEVLRAALDQALPAGGLQVVDGAPVAEGDVCGVDGC